MGGKSFHIFLPRNKMKIKPVEAFRLLGKLSDRCKHFSIRSFHLGWMRAHIILC